MGSSVESRKLFVVRLKEACDQSKNVPPPNRGRQQYIAQQLGVAAEAVSKWFKGVAQPKEERMRALAELLDVEVVWLSLGESPDMDRSERKNFAREVSGAVYLLMGLTMLSGSPCAMPSERDPRKEDIDFMAIVRGRSLAVHVCLARELDNDAYELTVPNNFKELNCVALISKAGARFDILDMPEALIDIHKEAKNGDYIIPINRIDGRYVSGESVWPKIRFIGDR